MPKLTDMVTTTTRRVAGIIEQLQARLWLALLRVPMDAQLLNRLPPPTLLQLLSQQQQQQQQPLLQLRLSKLDIRRKEEWL